eukprot:CAMPEP_0117027924 /NCGR_PEP_ID=MMETSP0472-20121206/20353_1 /TAXON_ID=693140 ORGANISM="Tiarina fusus, Strain LIS" /NCGR_SAMPLE_ID=MMETSP0472 /ASSEMBLY_ACC=CAM_ASM_000603 /LENGTH=438 /DNA_ID=CAMNT_0004735277 /DNA_START=124 /DNA_END=1440 /DNA_ORIENTATION=-
MTILHGRPVRFQMIHARSITSVRNPHINIHSTNITNRNTIFFTPQRFVVKDFLKNLVKHTKENIDKDAELGGQIKSIQASTKAATEISKHSASKGAEFAKTISNSVSKGGRLVKEVATKSKDKVREKTAPIVSEAKKVFTDATKAVGDVEEIKQSKKAFDDIVQKTGGVVNSARETTSKKLEETKQQTQQILDPVNKKVAHIKKKVGTSETVTSVKSVVDVVSGEGDKKRFNPTPLDKSKNGLPKNYITAVAVSKDSRWAKVKEKLRNNWQEWGDSDSRISYLVEAVDSFAETWKRISSSQMGIMINNLKKEHPDFDLDAFQEWVTKTLVPGVLTSKKYEGFAKQHSGDFIAHLYKTKKLPLPWKFENISSADVFPQDQEPTSYRFIFSIRGQVKEIDPETKKETIFNITLIVATKLNEENVWVMSEYQEIEKTESLF